MPSIAVRSLGMNGDPLEGNGINNFVYDIDAVAQIIRTTLLLFQGEWWENLKAGTPMFQSILGQENASQTQVIAAILQNVINSVPFVQDISNLTCTYNPTTRGLSFYAQVLTQFGTLVINNGV